MNKIKLRDFAQARSGDKGNHANIGVVAHSPAAFSFLDQLLTPELVAHYFRSLRPSRVERFVLPNIRGFNFMLYDVLDGGASRSLRTDTQGKLLGTALMELELGDER